MFSNHLTIVIFLNSPRNIYAGTFFLFNFKLITKYLHTKYNDLPKFLCVFLRTKPTTFLLNIIHSYLFWILSETKKKQLLFQLCARINVFFYFFFFIMNSNTNYSIIRGTSTSKKLNILRLKRVKFLKNVHIYIFQLKHYIPTFTTVLL